MADVYVFGSNLAGRHGAGSALHARTYFGAQYGNGIGRQGNSYAIPTKDHELRVLPLHRIKKYVDDFLQYAIEHYYESFNVVEIGCGLAGYTPDQIAPLFRGHCGNVNLPERFKVILDK